MKILIIAALALSGAIAQASTEEIPLSGDLTRLEVVKSWFEQGHALTFASFKGFYSGRCFPMIQPNMAVGSLIGYGSPTSSSEDAGPGFPQARLKISSMLGQDKASLDSEQMFPKNKKLFISELTKDRKKISDYSETPTLSYTLDWEANGNPDERFEFVSYNNYIVMRWTAALAQDYGPGMGRRIPGDIIAMCYYFKKLE